ncbi:pyridoxal-dependent decarboxylase domain protein [Seiridium cupressi]
MAVEASTLFPGDLVSKLKPEPPEVKSREPFDVSDESSDTVYHGNPPHTTAWTSFRAADVSHQVISSYFIGPQAENLPYFEKNIHTILEELRLARTRYFPEDGKFINESVQKSPAFKKSMKKLSNAVQKAANILGRTSIPFWSPRYEAHMCTDMSMASLLGYFMTMIYNPNNVALEASPLSTVAEMEVGEQLCDLFGYNIDEDNHDAPVGWGHVTCGGTVANLESICWPKGAAVAGIGSDNVVGIPVDNAARVDLEGLEKKLEENLQKKHPVLAVVAIIGSTEEGAVDPLSSILALRKQFQAKGLSFLVHADAAWGGYFCSMLPKDYRPGDIVNLPTEMGDADGFVPDASLRAETQEDLFAIRFADSVTVDPHKAGYIPYPAGALCYRDGRMRYLVTWTSPYLSRGSVTSIGIYGVEGSKPGAAAVSAWLSNKTIGLNQQGYGALLSEVTWTCTRLSAEWAAMTNSTSPFICVPFNELPAERAKGSTPERVEAEKARIRNEILKKSNSKIVEEDQFRPDDQKAMKLMRDLGSDLNINAFAINFRYSDGRLNEDIEEANYLMKRVIEALSVDSPDDDPTKIPLYLTSTEFSDELYGNCKKHFMKRLGLEDSTQDLMVLRNVVMSPFPTDGNFINRLAEIFYKTVQEETIIVRKRNEVNEDLHSFLIQGSGQIYLIHLPMFHVANHRQQLIISVDFDNKSRQKYVNMKTANPTEPMILVTQYKTMPRDILKDNGTFTAQITTKLSGVILKNIKVTVTSTVVSRPLNSRWRLPSYPKKFMPFYLYGNAKEANIDHVIVRAPNTQLSAGRCSLKLEGGTDQGFWSKPLILVLDDVYEETMQPFPPNSEIVSKNGAVITHSHAKSPAQNGERHAQQKEATVITSETRSGRMRGSGFFFRPGAKFNVKLYEDGNRDEEDVGFACFKLGKELGKGTIELGQSVYVDSEGMNFDPFQKVDKVAEWKHEFDQIGKELD